MTAPVAPPLDPCCLPSSAFALSVREQGLILKCQHEFSLFFYVSYLMVSLLHPCNFLLIDVGNAQLSMHSIREVCGTEDVSLAIKLFEGFFEEFPSVDARLTVD